MLRDKFRKVGKKYVKSQNQKLKLGEKWALLPTAFRM